MYTNIHSGHWQTHAQAWAPESSEVRDGSDAARQAVGLDPWAFVRSPPMCPQHLRNHNFSVFTFGLMQTRHGISRMLFNHTLSSSLLTFT